MTNANQIINVARGEVGTREGYSNGHWNNNQKYSDQVPGLEWSDYQPWCATFVSWCAMISGLSELYPRTASCSSGLQWFKDRGRTSDYPAIGAQVFYGPGGGTHTGIVYGYDRDYIYTVEGNTNETGSAEGNGVYYKKRYRRDAYVYKYGYPRFSEGIVSADPAYAGQTPKLPPPYPGASAFVLWKSNPNVTLLDGRLIAKGYTKHNDGNGYQAGPVFTDYTRLNVRDFQLAQGWTGSDADGYPGPETWARLFR